MVLAEIAELWKAEKKDYVKPASYSAYTLLLEKHIIPVFGNQERIAEDDIQRYILQKLKEGLSKNSIQHAITVLKMVMYYGASHKYCEKPEWNVRYPVETRREGPEIMDLRNQRKLMKYLCGHQTTHNFGILLCLYTGLRIGELCALQWKDLDMHNGIVTVRKTLQRLYVKDGNAGKSTIMIGDPKTRTSWRDIPMPNDLIIIMRKYGKNHSPDNYIITDKPYPLEPRTYRVYFHRLLKRIGLPDMKFHCLRHSFATRCIESGCDYKTVSVLLGHANISTTLNLYVHPGLDQKKKCMDRMSKSLRL